MVQTHCRIYVYHQPTISKNCLAIVRASTVFTNDQWRICFEWRDNDAYNVEVVDYH